MIVTEQNANIALSQLSKANILFLDTETTGLMWHQGNKPFSIIIADEVNEPWYFNLYSYNDTQYVVSLDILKTLQKIFNQAQRVVIHNAKFDMHMLANIGITIKNAYDTMCMHRLVDNRLFSYSLDSLTGIKSNEVKEWINKNRKIAKVIDENGELQPAYWKVPFDIMTRYATQDVVALRKLYYFQIGEFAKLWESQNEQDWPLAYHVELKATQTIWECERRGILLDVDYSLKARKQSLDKAENARKRFKELTGEEFLDSDIALDRVFKKAGIDLPLGKPSTKLGKTKPKTDEETILATGHPIAQAILDIRKPEKKVSTYFDNYIKLRNQKTGAVHCDFRQTGADTMRMSASSPNVQNAPDESEEDPKPQYPIRGCFIPRPEFKLVSIDFSAQEMRSILDTAGEETIASKILGGEDVHQVTADEMGVKRKLAKNIAFGIIYGSGAFKTSLQIGCSIDEARRLRDLYFSKLPKVRMLSKALMRMSEEYGYIVTRFGNRLFIDQGFSYKAVNYFVQGSCAIHTKNAANKVRDFLLPYNSKILLLIHDELLIEMHESEMHLIPSIQKLMSEAYPHNILPQDTGVEIYKYRWGGETCKM